MLPKHQSLYIALAEGHKAYKLIHLFSTNTGSEDKSQAVAVDFEFFVDLDTPGPRLRLSIYGSEQDNLDGQNFYVSKRKRRDGLEEWPLHFADPPTWVELKKKHGIKPKDNGKGRQAYYLITRVEVSREKDSLFVTTKLYAGREAMHRGRPSIWTDKSELWNAHRSHNVSNGRAPVQELPAAKRVRLLASQQTSSRSSRRRAPRARRPENTSEPQSRPQASTYGMTHPSSGTSSNRSSTVARRTQSPLTVASTSALTTPLSSPLLLPQVAAQANAALSQLNGSCGPT